MQIKFTSILVDDQARAHKFYTDVLGFVTKRDIPMGEFHWITVVSPEGPADVELRLEPNANPAAQTYQRARFEQGIAAAAFNVDDIQKEYERLNALGVEFIIEPRLAGLVMVAVFDDTCGNLIQINQV